MKQSIVHVAVVVREYDEAIDFYVNKLKFELIEDLYQPEKEWKPDVLNIAAEAGV